ncbi:oxidoreductase,short chain dehydrogenase-like protein [Boeremia exigua]|uniref:oxidoreductase,short chain dehydrogenase-like protein n=1 Tax=Boeremia exigua TaxID=749465 RepID=UPI001E8EB6F1|nr:oxidoreductase,short chain dehydrogenase-like protein [Boeremia exigua]KAH6625104.1 oxidoreductase,short chain dehydrogenase-like protein [Boeremia exigua]
MSTSQIWLITGTSSGFGEAFVKDLLARGDKVIATARNTSRIAHLKQLGAATIQLDVTASQKELENTAKEAINIYGKIDVLVNNAGYSHFGTFEDSRPEDWQKQFDTNVFGAINTTRAFLPHLRGNKSGTIVFIGSAAALSGMPLLSLYCASKFALTGAAESLSQEVAPFGIRTLIVQPGFFRTAFLSEMNPAYIDTDIDDYKEIVSNTYGQFKSADGKQPGDPEKGANRVIDVVKGEGLAKGKGFPGTLMLGADVWSGAKQRVNSDLKLLEEWEKVSDGLDH